MAVQANIAQIQAHMQLLRTNPAWAALRTEFERCNNLQTRGIIEQSVLLGGGTMVDPDPYYSGRSLWQVAMFVMLSECLGKLMMKSKNVYSFDFSLQQRMWKAISTCTLRTRTIPRWTVRF